MMKTAVMAFGVILILLASSFAFAEPDDEATIDGIVKTTNVSLQLPNTPRILSSRSQWISSSGMAACIVLSTFSVSYLGSHTIAYGSLWYYHESSDATLVRQKNRTAKIICAMITLAAIGFVLLFGVRPEHSPWMWFFAGIGVVVHFALTGLWFSGLDLLRDWLRSRVVQEQSPS